MSDKDINLTMKPRWLTCWSEIVGNVKDWLMKVCFFGGQIYSEVRFKKLLEE